MEKKNVVIYVAGQRFSITTSDTPEYVMGIGEKIDVMIKGIQKDNPKLNRDACAILTALNICDDETKLRQMMEVLREQVKDYLVANEALRAENSALKKELETLKTSAPVKAEPEALEEKQEIPDTAIEEDKTEDINISVPTKTESVVAANVQRQTAFVGKDFRKNKKNKHNKNKHHNNMPTPMVSVPVAATPPEEAEETQAESPYHQFSIFDDLM